MRIMVEAKHPMIGRYYYDSVTDITVRKIENEIYYAIHFSSPEKPDVLIPYSNYRIYEKGWTQLKLEL